MTAKSEAGREFGIRLREAFQGASQTEIAEKLGISNASVSAYVKGDSLPSLDNLRKISALTKRSLHWLLTGEGESDLDPFRFLNETQREIIQKTAEDANRSFESVLSELITDALVSRGAALFGQYRTIQTPQIEQLKLLFRLFGTGEEDDNEQEVTTSQTSRRRA